MRDLIGKAELCARCRGVAAADDGRCALGICKCLCNGDGAGCKGGVLEHAHGAVPDDRLGALDLVGEELARLGADVEAHHVCGDLHRRDDLGLDGSVDGIGEVLDDDGIDGKEELLAHILRLLDHVAAVVELFVVDEGSADRAALRLQEGVCHAAADDERIALFKQVVDDVELVCDLRTAEDGDEGADGMLEGVCHDGELLLDEEAADGGLDEAVLDDGCRGGVRAVRGAECVVHIDVAEGSELLAELEVLLLLLPVEAEVFQEHAFALLAGGNFCLCVGADDVVREGDFAVQKLVEALCDGLERELFQIVLLRLFDDGLLGCGLLLCGESLHLCLVLLVELDFIREDGVRLAHVRAEDDLGAMLHQIFDGGKCADDAVLVGDRAVLHGDVKVAADEDALALPVFYVFHGHFVHSENSPYR